MTKAQTVSGSIDFFLGTTTPSGFKGYFSELGKESNSTLYLIKSGPGCGKSTFMKELAALSPTPVERIHCSSDPDSLDGVIFGEQHAAMIDATAPHTIEPNAPAADEVVISLYDTISPQVLRPHKQEVTALFEQNHTLRSRASRYIASAGSLLLDSRRAAACSTDFETIRRYTKRLCSRLLPRRERIGTERFRFLSAITPQGEIFYDDTVRTLATHRILVFRDAYGAASRLLMELIHAEALSRGYDIITCPCALHPEDKIDHILVPALGLSFLTDNPWHPVHISGQQTVRCIRFSDPVHLSTYRARLRFNEKAANELLQQAVALMKQAKSCHDKLETYYHAAVDFAAVEAKQNATAQMLGLKDSGN